MAQNHLNTAYTAFFTVAKSYSLTEGREEENPYMGIHISKTLTLINFKGFSKMFYTDTGKKKLIYLGLSVTYKARTVTCSVIANAVPSEGETSFLLDCSARSNDFQQENKTN